MTNFRLDIGGHVEKPKADISIITDYDQRYLVMISKIFYKEIDGWDDKSGRVLNEILEHGGNIAAFWYKMRLVGAVVWSWGNLEYIAFKLKEQGRGNGKILLDFVLHKISESGEEVALSARAIPNSPMAKFLEKYGFYEGKSSE